MDNLNGLSTEKALELQKQYGKNTLKEEKQKSIARMCLEQICNITNFVLIAAIVISVLLGDYGEACIIGIIIVANTVIGVVQERKAQKTLDALKKISTLKATVIRDGETKEISSEDLVPSDVVVLEAGKQVPADLKLIDTIALQIDEKALTGESVPVDKDCNFISDKKTNIGDKKDIAFSGTIVTAGRGIGIVEKIGMDTEIGKIADLVGKEQDAPSPLQKGVAELSKHLCFGVVFICIIMFVIGLIQGREVLDILLTSATLAVAAIPEGIPTIMTIVMAIGMQRMSKFNAIVKTLPAVETLGSVGYVCSDKTGTLTQNKMTVVKTYTENTYVDKLDRNNFVHTLFVNGFTLCNDASLTSDGEEVGDPTETALLTYAQTQIGKKDMSENIKKELESQYQRINELAFDSDRKLMSTLHTYKENGHKTIQFTKGSTDNLLNRCTKIIENNSIRNITDEDKNTILSKMQNMSDEALRVLSLAVRFDVDKVSEDDLVYVGMVGMIDPERPEVKASIAQFKEANVKTMMITGDHKNTAFAIAKNLGIAENIDECITGAEISELSDIELAKRVENVCVFARVSPEHKVRIVKALQANHHIVAMTGDGVNDSPSLKAADVGIAMGITGTDVAKSAADIILQDDSFVTIEKAIREGRNIYENVKKSIIFSLSSNVGEILMMIVAIISNLVTPLKASHILWINLMTDSLPCFALGVDTNSSSDVMKKPPRKQNESLFSDGGLSLTIAYGILIALIALGCFLFLPIRNILQEGSALTLQNISLQLADKNILIASQTYAFVALALSELFQAVGMRDIDHSLFKFNWFDNKLMNLALLVGLVGQIAVTEIPFLVNAFETKSLSVKEWGILLLVGASQLVLHEIIVLYRHMKHKKLTKTK